MAGRFIRVQHVQRHRGEQVNAKVLVRGLVAGVIGATVIAIFFFVLDLVQGTPFATPGFMAEALLDTPGAAGVPAYTVLHYTSFLVMGMTTAWALHRLDVNAPLPIGLALGGMLFGFISHKSFSPLFNKIGSIVMQERIMKIMALIIGCYGSYALGANNVANITGVFVNQIGVEAATLIGGVAIALGVITFSRRVMFTVGKKITPLDPFSSMIAILGESLTVSRTPGSSLSSSSFSYRWSYGSAILFTQT